MLRYSWSAANSFVVSVLSWSCLRRAYTAICTICLFHCALVYIPLRQVGRSSTRGNGGTTCLPSSQAWISSGISSAEGIGGGANGSNVARERCQGAVGILLVVEKRERPFQFIPHSSELDPGELMRSLIAWEKCTSNSKGERLRGGSCLPR